jgi:LruC domain-containing protein
VDAADNPVSTSFEVYSQFPGGVKFMDGTSGVNGLFYRKYKIANYRSSVTVVIPNQEPLVITFEQVDIQLGTLTSKAFQAKQSIVVSEPGFKSLAEETYQYYPAEGQFGTLTFEDTWPYTADYDFNDVVLDYNVLATFDDNEEVTKINMVLYLRASGANAMDGHGNGVGISFKHSWSWDGPYADIASVTVNGEAVAQEGTDYPSFILIDNVEDYQKTFNTIANQAFVAPTRFDVEIILNTPAEDWWVVDMPLNNMFIFDALNRSREIHLPWYLPTSLADPDLAGIDTDFSDSTAFDPTNFKSANMVVGYYTYMSEEGYPWGINVYFDEAGDNLFRYPVEYMDIREAYEPAFAGWVESWDPMDWYLPEYRIEGKVFETIPDPVYPEMQ